jgi:hypothetical protein
VGPVQEPPTFSLHRAACEALSTQFVPRSSYPTYKIRSAVARCSKEEHNDVCNKNHVVLRRLR